MKRVTFGSAMFGLAAPAAIGVASPAAALFGGAAADQVVQTLTARGYDVQINGEQDAPLSRCTVTDVDGLSATSPTGSTVYVSSDCPSVYRQQRICSRRAEGNVLAALSCCRKHAHRSSSQSKRDRIQRRR